MDDEICSHCYNGGYWAPNLKQDNGKNTKQQNTEKNNVTQRNTMKSAMKHKNIGGSFEDFLEEGGILEDVDAVATKRVVARQLQEEMEKQNISQAALARKMNTSRSSVRRLLDPKNESMTISTLKRAAKTMGKRVEIKLV